MALSLRVTQWCAPVAFGFVPPLVWAAALGVAIWKRRELLARRYWNRWVGALVGTVVVWGGMGYQVGYEGILKEVSLGGEIGQAIKGPSDILGAVSLLALAALAVGIAAPTGTLRWLRSIGPVLRPRRSRRVCARSACGWAGRPRCR